MLTEKEKAVLNEAFSTEGVDNELTLEQAQRFAEQTQIPLRIVEWFALDNGLTPCRYQRNVGSLGIAGQKKLLESKVIVVGLGGLGGYVLEELARVGVGQIATVDCEVFDETNLNRQLLCEEGNLGKKKVAQAKDRLKRVNKAVEMTGFATPLDELPKEIWHDGDLAFDCLGNIDDRFVLAERCSEAHVPLVHGAIAGWYGQVGVVWPGSGMLKKMYKCLGRGIERNIGTTPFTAAITASLMVAEGIKIMTGKNAGQDQKMLFFDLLDDDWQTITF